MPNKPIKRHLKDASGQKSPAVERSEVSFGGSKLGRHSTDLNYKPTLSHISIPNSVGKQSMMSVVLKTLYPENKTHTFS